MKKIAYLDRDGTIIKDKKYLSDPKKIEFLDGAIEALSILSKNGFDLVIVTNQSGIARNYFTLDEYKITQDFVEKTLSMYDINVKTRFCPHLDECFCRKPLPGMLYDSQQYELSVIFGDKDSDILAGELAKCSFCYLVTEDISLLDCTLDLIEAL